MGTFSLNKSTLSYNYERNVPLQTVTYSIPCMHQYLLLSAHTFDVMPIRAWISNHIQQCDHLLSCCLFLGLCWDGLTCAMQP